VVNETPSSGTGITWGIKAAAVAEAGSFQEAGGTVTDPLVFGTENTGNVQYAAVGKLIISTAVTITIGNSPTTSKLIVFKVKRDVTDSGDNLIANALLIGVGIQFNNNATPAVWT
jgi:hypothetical protein